MSSEDSLLAAHKPGSESCLFLVAGDRVVAEPAAVRLGEQLAARHGSALDTVRRPENLIGVLQDLRTLGLFSSGKVVVAIESDVLADAGAAAALIDEVAQVLPVGGETDALAAEPRAAAIKLLQALRLFQVDPYAGSPESAIADLPESAVAGGAAKGGGRRRKRTKAQQQALRDDLTQLLVRARQDELRGCGSEDAQELAELVADGLPEGHFLILAESRYSAEHPVVRALSEKNALLTVGEVAKDRRQGWSGLRTICEELENQTGVAIHAAAAAELARRTLRQNESRGKSASQANADSTARFAAEYRKLATLAGDGEITKELVAQAVEDRGQEEVWEILDAVGEGKPNEVAGKVRRLLQGADDVVAARLSLLSLVLGFCRQLAAVGGQVKATGVAPTERNYRRFKDSIAPRLQSELPDGRRNPLSGLHPYRLHRVYLAASNLEPRQLARLPARSLETEWRIKGGSGSPDSALMAFMVDVAGTIGRAQARSRRR